MTSVKVIVEGILHEEEKMMERDVEEGLCLEELPDEGWFATPLDLDGCTTDWFFYPKSSWERS